MVDTPTTRMRLASIARQFTSLAVLLRAEEGKLDVDAPVRGVASDPKDFELHSSRHQTGMDFAPAHGKLYRHTGCILLDLVIERASA